MNDALNINQSDPASEYQSGWGASERLVREAGILAGRLEAFLAEAFPEGLEPIDGSRRFLKASYEAVAQGRPLSAWAGNALERRPKKGLHPLDRLARAFALSSMEIDLLLLAGLSEEHEGYADVLRTLHPWRQPWPTAGLAAQLLCRNREERQGVRRILDVGAAMKGGIIRLEGEVPYFGRNLVLAEDLWSVLHGIDVWPQKIHIIEGPIGVHGLDSWLAGSSALQARKALDLSEPCTILITAEDEEIAFERAAALVHLSGNPGVRIRLPVKRSGDLEALIRVHTLSRGVVPILCLSYQDGPGMPQVPDLGEYPAPVVVCARAGAAGVKGMRALIEITCDRLGPSALVEMWRKTLPQISQEAYLLAARYPMEPSSALQVAADLRLHTRLKEDKDDIRDVVASIRSRSGAALKGGVRLLRPTATWDFLVLSHNRLAQLREAINRLAHQVQVLDRWRFLEGRHGARGVRMLFSGPPGTGKTLSSEVMAQSLGMDLLIIDLSRVVSKWIGETEKNLAEVFETAERARAVLLFDEADALFGKRTEVSDAHDRYANLETAYLLARLERFEGLTILSTNLRQNIDPAFTRRMEFVVEFDEPTREERLALWKCHIPGIAPLAKDVNLAELAAHYSMAGGLIRNAAVAAAFLAAGDGRKITRTHLIRAVRREYDKIGKAFPGLPAGMTDIEKGGST